MQQKDSPLRSLASRPWVVPLALAVFALGLRLIGIGWGLRNDLHNQSYHPDELLIYSVSQRIDLARGQFAPGFYNYPTLYFTLLRVSSDIVAAYGGRPDGSQAGDSWRLVSRCHLAGRVLSAIAGALTALMLFLLLRRWVTDLGAGLGALLVAVAPAHVVHSRFQTADVLATFFLTVSLFFALKLLPSSPSNAPLPAPWKLILGAAVFAGLSAGTKYTGGLAIVTMFVALAWVRPPHALRLAALAAGSFVVTFLLTTPGILMDSTRFWHDFNFELSHAATGHGLLFVGYPSGFWTQFVNLVVGIGPLMVLLAMAGLAVGCWRRAPWIVAVASFGVAYWIVIGRAEVMFLRYTFPVYPVLACGFAWLVSACHERKGWGLAVVLLAIMGVGGLDPGAGLRASTIMTGWMAGVDPRDAAARYLRSKGSRAVVGLASDPWYYTPPLYPDSALGPPGAPFEVRDKLMREATAPRVERYVPPDPAGRFDWDSRLLTETKPDFVVYSSFEAYDVERLRGVRGLAAGVQVQVDREQAFSRALRASYDIDQVFGGSLINVHDLEYIHPTIWIWKRRTP